MTTKVNFSGQLTDEMTLCQYMMLLFNTKAHVSKEVNHQYISQKRLKIFA